MKTDNELIAEFMGFTCDNDFGWYEGPRKEGVITAGFGGVFAFNVKDSLFDTSWDWLMPVVEKIESLDVKFKIDGVRVLVVSKQLQYYWNGGMVSEPKIICVYHGCVQFIKWYNSQAEYKR